MADYRDRVIEECARELETCSGEFLELAKTLQDEEAQMHCYQLADSYTMAAEDIRRLLPKYREEELRAKRVFKTWIENLRKGVSAPMPKLDRSSPSTDD